MQVKCIKAHGYSVPGDLVDVPDGASVSELYWRVMPDPTPGEPAPTPDPDSAQQPSSGESSAPDEDGA